jgi:hypothetical protein
MKKPASWLAFSLFVATGALLFYRVLILGYPLVPVTRGQTWAVSIELYVKAAEEGTKVALGLPVEQTGRMVLEEKISAGAQSIDIHREGPNRVGIWSVPGKQEEQIVNFQTTIHVRPGREGKDGGPPPQPRALPGGGEEQALAERLISGWNNLPPAIRIKAIAATATGRWTDPPPGNSEIQAWTLAKGKLGQELSLLTLFHAAGLPSRVVSGLLLVNSVVRTPLRWIEIWDGQKWERLRPDSGEFWESKVALLPLIYGDRQAVRVVGGELREVQYVISREPISDWKLYFEQIRRSDRFLNRWSLFRLPEDFQKTFRILLLVPIGALIISALRNLIGFPTFGIFMPVLMALSFRNTGLEYGLGIFFGILLFGYAVRRALDKLRLLLVPRMSVLLTLVIGCFTILALVGSKIGLREFMAVGLLPFVILTMVIERFFVLVEEAGAAAGIRTALGSALVSVITYFIISWEPLQLTFFLYPELMAAVTALQILVGQYSGYRLMELFRFRKMIGS